MDKKEIGAKLKEMRINSNLKWDAILSDLKEKYSISIARSTIYGYENGHGSPDVETFLALCSVYGSRNILDDFGYNVHLSKSDGYEDITLFEDEFTAEQWQAIKSFLALIPKISAK